MQIHSNDGLPWIQKNTNEHGIFVEQTEVTDGRRKKAI